LVGSFVFMTSSTDKAFNIVWGKDVHETKYHQVCHPSLVQLLVMKI